MDTGKVAKPEPTKALQPPCPPNPSMIKFLDRQGYTRRIIVRKEASGPPDISFEDLANYIRNTFTKSSAINVRILYKEGDDIVAVNDDMELEAACIDLMPGQSLKVIPQQYYVDEGVNFRLVYKKGDKIVPVKNDKELEAARMDLKPGESLELMTQLTDEKYDCMREWQCLSRPKPVNKGDMKWPYCEWSEEGKC